MKKSAHIMSHEEFTSLPVGTAFVFDIEVYPNFFFLAAKVIGENKYIAFEQSPGAIVNQTLLQWFTWKNLLVGFNSKNFDIPLLAMALKGVSNEYFYKAVATIIGEKLRDYQSAKIFKINIPKINHVDLIEVAPLKASLKLYGGRMHCDSMQDLPYPPETILTAKQAEVVRSYCLNDLENTENLAKELRSQVSLRYKMSNEYNVDLRSKSDAQIAEAVIKHELLKFSEKVSHRKSLPEDYSFRYNVPEYVNFKTEKLRNVLSIVSNAEFLLDVKGSPILPKNIEKLIFKIGRTNYNFQIGGLHSREHNSSYKAVNGMKLSEFDVESFYPRIILNQQLYPLHLGRAFLHVYEKIVATRINAKNSAKKFKKIGDLVTMADFKSAADSLKIVINGLFGKFGNIFSLVYSPELLLQVTISGQLSLLMLIEMLELENINVVSGNTDGIVLYYKEEKYKLILGIIKEWERVTNFKTEETNYKAIYSRDVNNYIAVKAEGGYESKFLDEKLGCKTKGTYCERGSALNSVLSKNAEHLVCSDALLHYIVEGTSIEQTIINCKDIRRFISIRTVEGGAIKDGIYLGKAIRWYYSKGERGCIKYKTSGNKVAKTDGACPLINLPAELPNDIDYSWYIKKALAMSVDCGAKGNRQTTLF